MQSWTISIPGLVFKILMFSNETKRLRDHRTLTWNSYIYRSWEQTTFLTLGAFWIKRTYYKHITYSCPWKSPLNFTSQYAFGLLNFIFHMGSETKTNEGERRKIWLWDNQPQPSNLMPQMLVDFYSRQILHWCSGPWIEDWW